MMDEDNSTIRVVFYVDSVGGVEKVLRHTTEPCFECGAAKERDLTNEGDKELGRQATRVIRSAAHGCWYNGLIEELVKHDPEGFRGLLADLNASD